jgi:hypothetical protein
MFFTLSLNKTTLVAPNALSNQPYFQFWDIKTLAFQAISCYLRYVHLPAGGDIEEGTRTTAKPSPNSTDFQSYPIRENSCICNV